MYNYQLNFELNEQQFKCSRSIAYHFLNGKNILVDAVCGAGKTEMLLECLKVALNKNCRVGFACPRRVLLLELYERIKGYFMDETIGLVIGGTRYHENSNFIFLTTHQLTKYANYFDLLIIDEIDAFPFYDNVALENAALKASKQFIYLSATVPLKYLNLVKQEKLVHVVNYYRHHQKAMPVPKIKQTCSLSYLFYLFKFINKLKVNPLIIYVPTKKQGRMIEKLLKLFFKEIKFVCSDNLDELILKKFRKRELKILISTSVLERGITLAKLNVIVCNADNNIYNEAMLLQICGRVGRDFEYYRGNIYYLSKTVTKEMIDSKIKIEKYNEMLNL